MTDHEDLFQGLFSGPTEADFPPFPLSCQLGRKDQTIDSNCISAVSVISAHENEDRKIQDWDPPEKHDFCPPGSRVARSHVLGGGNDGNGGKSQETPAGSETYHFRLPSLLDGKEGRNGGNPASFLDPTTVRAGVAREMQALAAIGIIGLEAEDRAVAITRAKIFNSAALAERQAHMGRCHVCGEPLDDTAPILAVLSGKPDAPLFMHDGCHDAYRARRKALVDQIMAAVGLASGDDLPNGPTCEAAG